MRAIPTIPKFEKKSSIKKWGSQPKGVVPKGNRETLFKGLVSKQELVLEEWLWVVVLSESPRTPQVIIRGTEQ